MCEKVTKLIRPAGSRPESSAVRVALLFALALLASACVNSQSSHLARDARLIEREDFGRYFQEEDVRGTFVLYDLRSDRFLVHDSERARKRFIPASTFKIVNSLIALETGSIADTSTVLKWDGQEREVAAWNRDHSMTTAFRSSVVWYYQKAARRIGEDRMRDYVHRVEYGNSDIEGGIDQFWLSGDLRISAVEQVDLLVRLYRGELPFREQTHEAVKGIMVEERSEDYVLRSKTGWAQDVGWYVGYVERAGRPYFFALNIDMEHVEQAPLRKRIARAILRDLGLI